MLDNADEAARWWMFRALKGTALRSETYGLDNSSVATVPYTTTQQRMQVRLVQGGGDARGITRRAGANNASL